MLRMISLHRQKLIGLTLLLLTCGFLALTVFVVLDPLSKIDRKFSEEVQEHSRPVLDTAMRLISWPGEMPNSVWMVAVKALLLLTLRYKREALFIVLTLASGIVSTLLKLLVNRPRPQADMVRVLGQTRQQSFPSGHVLFYTVFFGFVLILMLRLTTIPKLVRALTGGLCLLLIFTVPLSRIYLGAHWFTDVTAGFIAGLLCLYALTYFYMQKPATESI